jgi:hypothetical protein
MSGLRLATIEARILSVAVDHASADEAAREAFRSYGRHHPDTWAARSRRHELRLRLARLGRLLAKRLEEGGA